MKCLILAAGYATRLYPLTENFPKPLLEVKGKTILDWLLDDIDSSKKINEYVVISNDKFFCHFEKWASEKTLKAPITLVNDGSKDNDNRLGAVADIKFAIDTLNIDDDIIVIAGDNVLDFSLCNFIDYFESKKEPCVMRYYEERTEKLRKTGVASVDDEGLITKMVEKPENPESNWCIPPFYAYPAKDLKMLDQGIKDGCKTDAPGSFVVYLASKQKVYAMEMPGKRYDIGDLKSYEEVNNKYGGITR